jgi:hypothetical protein
MAVEKAQRVVTVTMNRVRLLVDAEKLVDDYQDVFMQTVAVELGLMDAYKAEGVDTLLFVEEDEGKRLAVSLKQLYKNIVRFLKEDKDLQWAAGTSCLKIYNSNRTNHPHLGHGSSRDKPDQPIIVRLPSMYCMKVV